MDIYLYLNEQQSGPYSEDQVRAMVATGSMKSTDLAWREGAPGWQPLNTLISLVPVAPPPPPRPLPVVPNKQKLKQGLAACKTCGNPVSKSAKACPTCGAPVKRSSSLGGCGCLLLLLIVGIAVVPEISNIGGNSVPSTTNTQPSPPTTTPNPPTAAPTTTPASTQPGTDSPPIPAPVPPTNTTAEQPAPTPPPPSAVSQADRDAVAADPAIKTTRKVEGECAGRYFNDVWKIWSDEPITVYVDKRGNVYIHGGQSLIEATCDISPVQSTQVIDALTKSLDWSKQAKENKLETSKDLISFQEDGDTNQLSLTFFAAEAGDQTDVVMNIVGFDNQFSKIKLYLNPSQVQQMIDLLSKAPATYDDLVRSEIKAKNLQ